MGIEYGIAVSAIMLGAAVLFELRPPLAAAALLVGVFAIFHGYAHGTELPPGQSGLLYSMGFVIATGCLHGVGIGIGTVHRWQWGQTFVRVAGGVVAVAGCCSCGGHSLEAVFMAGWGRVSNRAPADPCASTPQFDRDGAGL